MSRSFTLLAVVAAITLSVALANPAVPDGYVALLNSTVEFINGQTFNLLQTYYQGHNASLSVSFTPGQTPYQLSDGANQNAAQYNPASKYCEATCVGGDVCPSGKCNVYGAGLFGVLPYAKASGACTFNVSGATKYTINVPNGDTSLGIEYCFISNQPIYVLEKVIPGPTATTAVPMTINAQRHLSVVPDSDDLTIALALFVVERLDVTTPDPATFDLPNFCACKGSL